MLDFFTSLFHQNASFGTMNSARAALAFLYSSSIGTNPSIKRCFNGVYHIRPTKPKYEKTWDPDVVLNYVKSLFPNEELSLRKLSTKLITLLALATGQRVQTLSLISLENITTMSEGIEIKIPDRIKTSRRGVAQPVLYLPFFSNSPELYVASLMIVYINQTRPLRSTNKGKLWLTYKKPHLEASSATLSRWIKEILKLSGVDTSVFSAHSTRHASASLAFRKGVNLDVLRKTVGWSKRSQTFAKFYNRPIINDNSTLFAKTVFSTK